MESEIVWVIVTYAVNLTVMVASQGSFIYEGDGILHAWNIQMAVASQGKEHIRVDNEVNIILNWPILRKSVGKPSEKSATGRRKPFWIQTKRNMTQVTPVTEEALEMDIR